MLKDYMEVMLGKSRFTDVLCLKSEMKFYYKRASVQYFLYFHNFVLDN